MSDRSLRIHWVIEGLQPDGQGGVTSTLASHRYRAILPAEGLRDLGHEVRLLELDDWLASDRPGDADVVVIGKLVPIVDYEVFQRRGQRLLEQARAAAGQGACLVADFNDDHFDHPQLGAYWRELARLVRARVVGSEAMKQRLLAVAGGQAHVVGDPLGSPHGRVRVRAPARREASRLSRWWRGQEAAGDTLRLLWFGHPLNWPPMARWLPALARHAEHTPLSLQVVTEPWSEIDAALADITHRSEGRLQASSLPWDEATQWAELERCDIVLIPSDPDDPRKSVKTANRLTDALHAGRWVIASPLPAYRPWAEFVCLADEPVAGLERWAQQGEAIEAALLAGQQAVEARCSVPAIAQAWLDAFSAALRAAAPSAMATSSGTGVRINLGCGARHMPGFINVDFGENWSGVPPDVVADVTKTLPFPDEHADEIHAYHVLEHILHWEVEGCLREWLRVLRPGGRLVLELPCLDKILAIFQSHVAAGQPAPVNLTMWGLFGDPGHRDVHMLHRWCYSIDELRQLLARVGLVDITTETPLTHVPIRDMRMIGVKPAAGGSA